MLSRGRQSMWRRLKHTPIISQNFAGEWNMVCSATAGTKTALGIIQLWFKYFTGIFFQGTCQRNIKYLKIPKKHRGPRVWDPCPSQWVCKIRVTLEKLAGLQEHKDTVMLKINARTFGINRHDHCKPHQSLVLPYLCFVVNFLWPLCWNYGKL